MSNVRVNGMNKEVYFDQDEWTNELTVDLEELAAGNLDKAFSVNEVHSTNGTPFRVYHGIDVDAKLPNGATRETIQELCDQIAARAEELTAGFSVEWNGSNHVAVWRNENGEKIAYAEEHAAYEYWHGIYGDGGFRDAVADLDCVEVYDCSDCENLPYVHEGIQSNSDIELTSEENVLAAINEVYNNEETDEYYFIGHGEAARKIWEHIEETREDA